MDIRKELDDVLDDCDYGIIKFHQVGKGCGVKEVTVVMQKKPFDLIVAWEHKEEKRIQNKLNKYHSYCNFADGFLVVYDKGMLVNIDNIKDDLNIGVDCSLPFISVGIGQTVCDNMIIINMAKFIEDRSY